MQLAWGAKVSPLFRQRLLAMAMRRNFVPDHAMACFAFETGRKFTADVRNPISGATGLIQFMPSTARDMGTTVDALAALPPEDQLEWVEKYLVEHGVDRVQSLSDLYMTILWPKAVGLPEDAPLFKADDATSKAYFQNKGLDLNKDGVVTKAEAAALVAKQLAEGLLPQNAAEVELDGVAVPTQPAAPIVEAPPQPQAQPSGGKPMLPMLIPFVLSLVQSFIAPKAAQALAKAGVTPDGVGQITSAGQALIGQVVEAAVAQTGKADEVKQATASGDELALARAQINALMQARDDAEARARTEADVTARMDAYFKAVAPLIDKIAAQDEQINAARIAGRSSAMQTHTPAELPIIKDVVRTQNQKSASILIGIAAALIVGLILKAQYPEFPGEYITGLLALAVSTFTSVVNRDKDIISYYMDGTPSSNATAAANAAIVAGAPPKSSAQ